MPILRVAPAGILISSRFEPFLRRRWTSTLAVSPWMKTGLFAWAPEVKDSSNLPLSYSIQKVWEERDIIGGILSHPFRAYSRL
jgi:hypothetical protein